MDATRADVEFTAEVVQIALDEGATTINIPDTVGYAMPQEYAAFLTRLYELRAGPARRRALRALPRRPRPGGGQLVRRRAGRRAPGRVRDQRHRRARGQRVARGDRDAPAHAPGRRRAAAPASSRREIARTSRLVARLTGYPVQPNKAIVGRNAFAHESGIHQDGVLKERSTYEIMDATTVGLEANELVLGKHSGRHALRQALEELGYQVDGQALNTAFKRFKEIADKKKQVTAMDLEALVTDELREERAAYTLRVVRRRGLLAPAAARDRRRAHARRATSVEGSFTGDGPIDAVFRAINAATGLDARLREFRVDAVTGGQDALGEVSVVVELGGQRRRARGPARRAPARARHRRRPGGRPPTSSRRRASPTRARSPTPCGASRTGPPRTSSRRPSSPPRDRPASAGRRRRRARAGAQHDGRRARRAGAAGRAGRGARPARGPAPSTISRRCAPHPGHPGEEAPRERAVGADRRDAGARRGRRRAGGQRRTSTSSPRGPCRGATAPWSGALEDGWLYGRGSVDMKGAVVAALHALAEVARAGGAAAERRARGGGLGGGRRARRVRRARARRRVRRVPDRRADRLRRRLRAGRRADLRGRGPGRRRARRPSPGGRLGHRPLPAAASGAGRARARAQRRRRAPAHAGARAALPTARRAPGGGGVVEQRARPPALRGSRAGARGGGRRGRAAPRSRTRSPARARRRAWAGPAGSSPPARPTPGTRSRRSSATR